jgi:UDP-GlcNAc:undecaprenyl-phosphate GlcNAc-1-phosphate transferase
MTRAASAGGRAGGLAAAAITGGLAAAAARVAYAGLTRQPPGGTATWARTNHRGEQVTLLEGPAVAAAAVAAAVLGPALPARGRAALAVAGTGAAAFGCYDDLAGSGKRRGFRGHLGALAHGELTSGAVKIGGIGASGAAAGALVGGCAADMVINAGLAAGGANLLNLFDLRPGRAIKVTLASAALLAAGSRVAGPARCAAAAPAGAALALLPDDLGERAMLGDAGANALGAMLGTAAAVTLPRKARVAALAVIVGLTAASEVVSFTKVIERTPPLHWLDMLGRRPAAAAAGADAVGPAGPGTGSAADRNRAVRNGAAGADAVGPDGPGTGSAADRNRAVRSVAAGADAAGQEPAGQEPAGQEPAGPLPAGAGAQPGQAGPAPAAAAGP